MQTVKAAAILLINNNGEILISKRRKDQIYPDYWEFPGGKLEENETAESAARREAREEVGAQIINLRLFETLCEIRKPENAPAYKVTVDIFAAIDWEGEIMGKEGQEVGWIKVEDLEKYTLLPANIPLIPKILHYVRNH